MRGTNKKNKKKRPKNQIFRTLRGYNGDKKSRKAYVELVLNRHI